LTFCVNILSKIILLTTSESCKWQWSVIYILGGLVRKMASSGSESGDGSCDLSKSPIFTDIALNNIRSQETKGVPLQTAWTFWLDKYGIFTVQEKVVLFLLRCSSVMLHIFISQNHTMTLRRSSSGISPISVLPTFTFSRWSFREKKSRCQKIIFDKFCVWLQWNVTKHILQR
jgi:hypothetical protein